MVAWSCFECKKWRFDNRVSKLTIFLELMFISIDISFIFTKTLKRAKKRKEKTTPNFDTSVLFIMIAYNEHFLLPTSYWTWTVEELYLTIHRTVIPEIVFSHHIPQQQCMIIILILIIINIILLLLIIIIILISKQFSFTFCTY